MSIALYLRNGYLKRARILSELAQACGIDTKGLETTVNEFNKSARQDEDPEFGRGLTAFNCYLGDPAVQPNPNAAPIEHGPFYSLRIYMGDLGTFDGLSTNVQGQVLGSSGYPIEGLSRSVTIEHTSWGNYPGAGITLGDAGGCGRFRPYHE